MCRFHNSKRLDCYKKSHFVQKLQIRSTRKKGMISRMNDYIRICDVEKYYGNASNVTKAVDRVSFQVDRGEFVGVMGPSGSGKTTLLNMLATIDRVTAGHIYYENTDITELSEDALSEFRKNNLGFVFQEYNLLDTLTIEENIVLALALQDKPKKEIVEACGWILKLLQIEDVRNRFPYQVSGGQKQRCSCGRAMVNHPKLLLADEPTGALDSKSAQTLLETFTDLNRRLKATILMVTHDAYSASYCGRILFLKDGRIFHELVRGEKSRKIFLQEILDVLSLTGGVLEDENSIYKKLSLRNMKRSMKDYLAYMLTMILVTALMYAFNSLIFRNELEEYFELEDMMGMMTGLATFFIMLIVAWLINYMVRFMLEKRSTEFGVYLLLGMKRRTIAQVYRRENLLLGCTSFLIGICVGVLLQQVLMAVMFAMVRLDFHLDISIESGTILLTAVCYAGCYFLALLRCKRKFKKMDIHALMDVKRRNEEIREKHEHVKQILFPLSVLFILMFWRMFGRLSNMGETAVFLIGLVITIYLFYLGLSAWIICYVRRGGNAVYRGQNLFLLRQFASKMRTMQFTMGTLTALFTLALMGASIALMFSEYENTMLEEKFPFDVQIYSSDPEDDFAKEKEVIEEAASVSAYYSYYIYTDGENLVNTWILTHLKAWGAMFQNADGTPNEAAIDEALRNQGGNGTYYTYDTYMSLTDYNHLRGMLGYQKADLDSGEYLVQVKSRLEEEVEDIGDDLKIKNAAGDGFLSCAGVCTDPFSQDGHNGADYLIIVPDEVLGRMKPYYAELVAEIDGEVPMDLQRNLEALLPEENPDVSGHLKDDLCCGSDLIISTAAIHLVRGNLIPEVKYMLASLIIPLFYIGLVFVCVAVTVLSVQQVSDAAKYQYRYDVLAKLGLSHAATDRLILKQLAAYYLCPALLAIVISGKMILFASGRFIMMTGVPVPGGGFFAKSVLLFFGIYLVYFGVTYVEFKRSVEKR